MRKYQLCWQPYHVVQSKKVIKSQSVEVPASSMDPPHSYLSCIFLADLSQNISLSVLKVNAVPGPRIHSVNWPNTKPQKTDSYKLQKVHYPIQSLMMQLDVGGKQSMVRPTVATKECYYYAMAQTEQTVSYKICLVTARGCNDGKMSPVLVPAGKSGTLPCSHLMLNTSANGFVNISYRWKLREVKYDDVSKS